MLERIRALLRKWLLDGEVAKPAPRRAAWRKAVQEKPFDRIAPAPVEEVEEKLNKAVWAVQGGRRRMREQMIQRHRADRAKWLEALQDTKANGGLFD